MLYIDLFARKPRVKNPAGEEIIDLTAASFDFSNLRVNVTQTVIVSEDVQMRPDLVARFAYGDTNKMDYICKLNGISNPFSLEAGSAMMIGDIEQVKAAQATAKQHAGEGGKDDIRKRFFDPSKLTKKDQKRLEYIREKSKTLAGDMSSNLPPNFAEPGSKEIKVKDGKVVFGEDVVGAVGDCPEPQSRARVKAKLLENRIFKNTNETNTGT